MKRQVVFLGLLLLLAAGCAGSPDSASDMAAMPKPRPEKAAAPAPDQAAGEAGGKYDDVLADLEADFDEQSQKSEIADPLYLWNKAMFHFNDKLYFWVLKPVAQGYKVVAPDFVRVGAKNFFRNLATPARLVNCVLQGKGAAAEAEVTRFLVNSTVGVLGFVDIAGEKLDYKAPGAEDLGQTLAVYGIGDGIYIVWPFFGSSTLRDSVGMVGDSFLDPIHYVDPTETAVGIKAYDTINQTSFQIGDYESIKDSALVPYEAFRDAYLQYRKKKIEQ